MTYSDEMRADDEATLAERRGNAIEQQNARRLANTEKVDQMKDKGYSNAAIAQELGLSESTVRRIVEG